MNSMEPWGSSFGYLARGELCLPSRANLQASQSQWQIPSLQGPEDALDLNIRIPIFL